MLKIKVVIVTIVALVIAVITTILISKGASEKRHLEEINKYQKYYTSYTVEYGDTVSEIYDIIVGIYPDTSVYSREEYIELIGEMNGLHNVSSITAGCNLMVVYLKGEVEKN